MKEAKTIALCNQKGGTGKTTTAINLGIGLAKQGKTVLMLDTDPQGDMTTALGYTNTDELPVTLKHLMERSLSDQPFYPESAIIRHPEGVDLIPSNIELSTMELSLVTAMSREFVLRDCIAPLKKYYDYILIDSMPSLGMLTVNVLAAADSVIIPVQAHYLPVKGMTQLVKSVNQIKRKINPDLAIDGVLLTMADVRTNMTKTVAETLHNQYSGIIKIYRNVIPLATKAAEASAAGQSIYKYDQGSKVACAYEGFTKEVLSSGEKQRNKARSAQTR